MKHVGVIGAGSFGTTVATLLSLNSSVLLFSRRQDVVDEINNTHTHMGVSLSPNIRATSDLEMVGDQCDVIFPVIRSQSFRETMKSL